MAEPADLSRRPAHERKVGPGLPTVESGLRHETLEQRPEMEVRAERAAMLNGREALVAQRSAVERLSQSRAPGPRPIERRGETANRTGLPDGLKRGIETLSGEAMDDVRVHYNSRKPESLDALAYAQGNEIHLGRGQERHLPHEAWHVVQQKQGRVRPTVKMKQGVSVNDEAGLEREADTMGQRALAHRPATERAMKLAVRPPPAAVSPVQGVWVTKKSKYTKGQTREVWVPAEPGDQGAEDTNEMSLELRRQVRAEWADSKDRKICAARDQLDREMGIISKPVDYSELFALGTDLDALTAERTLGQLSGGSKAKLGELSFRVLRALDIVAAFDEADSEAIGYRLLLQKYIDQIGRLDGEAFGKAAAIARDPANLTVTPEDVEAYRADIAESGTWGGGAEAALVASAFNFRTRLLMLDGKRNYVEVDTIGAGPLRARSLLNVGAHYKVVSDSAVQGQPYDARHVQYDAPGERGDCLFWALHYVAADGAATVTDVNVPPAPAALLPLAGQQFVDRARQIVSTGLGQDEIEHSIFELRVTGGRSGLGPRLSRRMNLHISDKNQIRSRLRRTGKQDSELRDLVTIKLKAAAVDRHFRKFKTLDDLLDAYDRNRALLLKPPGADKPKEKGEGEETATAAEESQTEKQESQEETQATAAQQLAQRETMVQALAALADALLAVAAENMPSVESMLVDADRQSPEIELPLRKDSAEQLRRKGIALTPSPFVSSQFVIDQDGTEYVMDRIGQLVPRFVTRGISKFNEKELQVAGSIYPTGESPVPDDDSNYGELQELFSTQVAKSGSGTGGNKVDASLEMQHVEGEKPSPFMSATSFAGGTVNPQGQSFGSALYRIDLAYLPPTALAATYTDRGMGYYLLSAFRGGKDKKADVIKNARKFEAQQTRERAALAIKKATATLAKDDKAFGADDAEGRDSTLSGKEWQALMDVIRTGEVLIKARIPGDAMKKL